MMRKRMMMPSWMGRLAEVIVVHHDAHGLPHHTEDAPEERVADEGIVEASVDVLGQHDQRHLSDLRDDDGDGDS